ncbi:MAG: STAS domain-containing protein [Oscillospiraceae bacterium]|nr:STAS domain-containing protein [Oscillospiraceae bacterium]MDD6146765.1 STAS domain-containing protein [Oscillospiraceae bacterium]
MSAKIEYKPKEIKVYLDGEIDHHSASLLRASIDEAIIQKKPSMLTLDFSDVSFMDSSGIGLVMGRYKLMKTVGGRIRVENLSASAYRVMVLAGLERLGEIKQKEVI